MRLDIQCLKQNLKFLRSLRSSAIAHAYDIHVHFQRTSETSVFVSNTPTKAEKEVFGLMRRLSNPIITALITQF